jgi:hypothetical protein
MRDALCHGRDAESHTPAQAGALTSAADSLWAIDRLAASQIESETAQGAPARATQMALPAQFIWSCGPATSLGIQTRSSKATISAVIRREASGAIMPVRSAAADLRRRKPLGDPRQQPRHAVNVPDATRDRGEGVEPREQRLAA